MPDCFNCPLPDCKNKTLERCDSEYTRALNAWVKYQNACLAGNATEADRRTPLMRENSRVATVPRTEKISNDDFLKYI